MGYRIVKSLFLIVVVVTARPIGCRDEKIQLFFVKIASIKI